MGTRSSFGHVGCRDDQSCQLPIAAPYPPLKGKCQGEASRECVCRVAVAVHVVGVGGWGVGGWRRQGGWPCYRQEITAYGKAAVCYFLAASSAAFLAIFSCSALASRSLR